MRVTLAAVKFFCPVCSKTTWFHRRPHNRFVCRGEMSPSMNVRNVVPDNLFQGCNKEFNKVGEQNTSIDKGVDEWPSQ